ncbi:MAG: aldo/keto reductase [Phycisphaerae bacterium]|nr:aldo/keto reductase [Phycisphaerae bacterium]
MRTVEFLPLRRAVPQIGLGCGALVGRESQRRSSRVIEAALDLGIRYFDVAPSYGMGTAEELLGDVLGTVPDVIITTKIGPPRPAYSARADRIRRLRKPILDRTPFLKAIALRALGRDGTKKVEDRMQRTRYDFSESALRSSLEGSLKRLKRDRVDGFLLHEPHPADLCPEIELRMQRFVDENLIRAFGAGVYLREDAWSKFGSIWQCGWLGADAATRGDSVARIFHGIVKQAEKTWSGATVVPPSQLLRNAAAAAPKSLLIVSASTPRRLRDLLRDV